MASTNLPELHGAKKVQEGTGQGDHQEPCSPRAGREGQQGQPGQPYGPSQQPHRQAAQA